MVKSWKRNLTLLTATQALSQTGSILILAIGGLTAGSMHAAPTLITLPLAFSVLGTLICLIPSSLFMQRFGRRAGFMTGALLGIAGAATASFAVYTGAFWLFCLSHLLLGGQASFMQYIRFAAAEQVADSFRSRAISLVLAGGVIASFIGPSAGLWTRDLILPIFLVSYIFLACLGLLQFVLVIFLGREGSKVNVSPTSVAESIAARPLTEIMAQPRFGMALVSSVVGYGLMIMLMSATPLAMQHHGHGQESSAFVIQWHVLGMFVPSFFTGSLIKRFGVRPIILTGALLLTAQVGMALTGTSMISFTTSLILLGMAWNFMFVGGSTLLTETYRPSERAKVQAIHDTLVFVVATIVTYAGGPLENLFGWQTLNLIALPFVALVPLVWFLERRKSASAIPAA